MADTVLHTQRLILRPPAPDDLPWLLGEMNTPAMWRHLGGTVRSPEEVTQGLAADMAGFADGVYQRWTVWLRDGACRIGRCGLFHIRSPMAPPGLRGQREIGWSFAERHWGKGYATEAARAVLDHALGAMGIAMVFAQTSDSNAPSTRLMQRLGLTRLPEFDYVDPEYPPEDNPTTIWSITAARPVADEIGKTPQ